MNRILKLPVAALALAALGIAQNDDTILRAMRDELERSRQLKVASLDAPYFMEYTLEDADGLSINASLGALISIGHPAMKIPTVHVRVGSLAFDNANHIYSEYYSGKRYDSSRLPLDNDYNAIRRVFWLATDRAYKTAQEAIGRKRSALKNVNQTEQLPDYSAASPVQLILPVVRTPVDESTWKTRTVKLSGIFNAYPQIIASSVEFQSIQANTYLLNSEGTALRIPDNLSFLRVRAEAQAPDGMQLRNADVFHAADLNALPSELDLKRGITAVADELAALTKAPVGEAYDGPVLFEPRAAAQLFAQVLGDNLKITRKPVGEPGRQLPFLPSELANKTGARILPDWMDVVDDPLQTEWRGQKLFGHYEVDDEGVKAQPINLVEKGVLKNFLLTRTPVQKGAETSNGHARLSGSFGSRAPGFGNLFIRASQTVPAAQLKAKLIEMIKAQNKPYGMLVRKLDFPSAMTVGELRRVAGSMAQSGGGTRPVALPLLIYRIYPDGHEELVRGMRFRGLSTRSFRDISAASDENQVLNFMDSTVPFALMGAGGFISNASVIAPGVLFESLELEKSQEDLPKLPIVPPPSLGT